MSIDFTRLSDEAGDAAGQEAAKPKPAWRARRARRGQGKPAAGCRWDAALRILAARARRDADGDEDSGSDGSASG